MPNTHKKNKWYKIIYFPNNKIVPIIITWCYSLIWCTIPLFTSNHQTSGYVLEGFQTSCSFDYLHRNASTRFAQLAMFIGAFMVPFFVLIFFCHLTYRALRLKGSYQFRFVRKSLKIKNASDGKDCKDPILENCMGVSDFNG